MAPWQPFRLAHPHVSLPPCEFESIQHPEGIDAELHFELLRTQLAWPLAMPSDREREQIQRDRLSLASVFRRVPPETWTYDDHPWLLLKLAAQIERHAGPVVIHDEREDEAGGEPEPFSRWALRTVLTAGAVTLAQCLTHPDAEVREVATRHVRHLSAALRRSGPDRFTPAGQGDSSEPPRLTEHE